MHFESCGNELKEGGSTRTNRDANPPPDRSPSGRKFMSVVGFKTKRRAIPKLTDTVARKFVHQDFVVLKIDIDNCEVEEAQGPASDR